ncbi:MAG: undecaprenyldiphospho-muramoylpentapeptide beta-N-acetylglucosaminyltransferase [Vicinamibacterales bacterium]
MRVLIAGGGTGGHLYPGLAVAAELRARVPGSDVTFVGTAAGLEARVIPREGYPLELIRSGGLKGKSVGALLRGLALLPLSAWDAWSVLRRRRPELVLGVGGYSSGPVVALAALGGVPTMLLEQNAMPGLTNRLLARVVTAAAVTDEASLRWFPKGRAFVSGNPVRAGFGQAAGPARDDRPRADGPVRVLVFGGSQGAHAINEAMCAAAPLLAAATTPIAVVHQTGPRDLEAVRDAYRRAGLDAGVEAFFFDMDRQMADADLAVCRAGATTLAELAVAQLPALLVPLPTATDDHQRWNAMAFVTKDAAVLVEQRDLTGERLAREILALAADPARRARMRTALAGCARPDAARLIVDRGLALAGVASADAKGAA